MTIYLRQVDGPDDKVDVFESDHVRIGRNADNDLAFDPEANRQVGRYHAEIYRDGDRYFVKDLQSRNGTFVGGRRILDPTPLAEGDVIQFAPGGPTRRFSTRRPGATAAAPEGAAPGRRRRTLLVVGAIAGAALLVGAAAGYFWWSWWGFFTGFVLAAALGALVLWSWTWWRARRERRAAESTDAGAQPSGTQRVLDDSWTKGVAALRQSKLGQRGEDALHALPWYLLLGASGSGRTSALRAARPLPSSVAAPRDTRTPTTCDWWFFEQCVVLDVTGRYLSQPDQVGDAAEWRRFLGLVRRTRRRPPLNGVVVTIPADTLVERSGERLAEHAAQVRRRLDETTRELGVVAPVYLLVTRLDALAGCGNFFARLPESGLDQAMGAMNERLEGVDDAGAVAEDLTRTVAGRLDAFRLALLSEAETASVEDATDVFLFVEEFKRLARPLRAFAEALFRRNPYHETPLLRAIYFATAAPAGGAPRLSAARTAP